MPDGKDGITNPLAYRKIHSDATGERWKAREMVYAKRRWTMPEQENRLLYSSYNASGWLCDATDPGNLTLTISPRADTSFVSLIDNGTTISPMNSGVQTWEGSGTIYSTSGVDVSSSTSFSFSLEFLPYQCSTTFEFTVVLGICDIDGSNQQEIRTWNLTSSNVIWFLADVADISGPDPSALGFYCDVTPAVSDGSWAVEDMCVQLDRYERKAFVQTGGVAVVNEAGERRGVGKIHPSEWELVQENWEGVVTPREGQDQASFAIPTEDV
jgi:hypothetical protein